MIPLIVELGGLGAVGYLGLLGASVGTIPATVRAVQLFVALAGAMLFFEPLAGLLEPVLASLGGRDFSALPWSLFLAFVMVYALFLAVAVIVTPPELTQPVADADEIPRREKVGGGALGAVAGVLIVGTALILLSMFPLPTWLHIRTHAMYYDLGGVCLRAVTPFLGSLAVYGEPPAEPGASGAHLSSEAWVDLDGDGKCGEADLFIDRDGFSEKQPYLDLDNDYKRRIGFLEKYSVWSWDDADVRVANVGPPVARPRPEDNEEEPARLKNPTPADAEDDIPGGKPAGPRVEPGKPKEEEEPSDDF